MATLIDRLDQLSVSRNEALAALARVYSAGLMASTSTSTAIRQEVAGMAMADFVRQLEIDHTPVVEDKGDPA